MTQPFCSALIITLAGLTTGCATPLPSAGTGFLLTDTKEAVAVTTHTENHLSGRACMQNLLGWFTIGDASIEAARTAGGIETIATVDREYFGFLGLYARTCTLVHGS